MKIILFGTDILLLDEWKKKIENTETIFCHDMPSLMSMLDKDTQTALIVDYDTVASEINSLIASASLPQNCIVLEKAPSVVTGKMLLFRGVKAYGNASMHTIHFAQMLQSVADGNLWSYPELTASIALKNTQSKLSEESQRFVEERLSEKERAVLLLILQGLTNDAIASLLGITTRTVKAHVSSIFGKLHVNDRVSLILLLK
ncbi:LuxR C-terminal-related transcriptional regulator [Sulfurimonas sp.]|uniref:helix-turn-helix domain-containing protein n=1 Tax=Sulfurimonas sp. TaxID=2022749 RepID=UPI00261D22FC|nr:LuxR C-terminal-related transcriptional regulator [Sulfurimonas sp.]MDD3451226.1 LuxR C-terminal-related transcriptional regulator [Sulfurimonas sp.]